MVEWRSKWTSDITVPELMDAAILRCTVFVVEQQCPYQEIDEYDRQSLHILGYEGEELMAYCRVIPPGVAYKEVSIGRVMTSQSARGTGLGKHLMKKAMESIHDLYGLVPIRIGAQSYLKAFYETHGFHGVGEEYIEDGISHIEMVYAPST